MTAATAAPASPFEHARSRGIHRNVEQILSARTDLRGKVIIELACGDGRTTHLLRSLGATVTPYDLLPQSYQREDTALPIDIQRPTAIPDASADLIIFQEVIEHLPNQVFALQEIHRILKPGGEVLLTTPSRSSLASKFSYLCFESETMKLPPWGPRDSVWLQDGKAENKCYGHLWLIGIQQLRTLAMVAGFTSVEIRRSEVSRSSVALMLPFPAAADHQRASLAAQPRSHRRPGSAGGIARAVQTQRQPGEPDQQVPHRRAAEALRSQLAKA